MGTAQATKQAAVDTAAAAAGKAKEAGSAAVETVKQVRPSKLIWPGEKFSHPVFVKGPQGFPTGRASSR